SLFPPRTEKQASRGSRGTAMSPPGRRTTRRNLRHGRLTLAHTPQAQKVPPSGRSRVALDYSGSGTPFVRLPMVPPQQSGYAAPPIRSDILRWHQSATPDRQSCELTRLAPVSSPSEVPG